MVKDSLVMTMQPLPCVQFSTLEDSLAPIKNTPVIKRTQGGKGRLHISGAIGWELILITMHMCLGGQPRTMASKLCEVHFFTGVNAMSVFPVYYKVL